jgi:tetratricopeptide (TPR) repeat protein
MSTPLNCLLAIVFGMSLTVFSTAGLANKIEESSITKEEWALLPAYCPHTMAFKGYTPENRAKWEPLMGGWKNFSAMHHYCWALIRFHRAEQARVPMAQKRGLRSMALDDFLYVLINTDEHFVLLPELLTKIGRTQLLLDRPNDADQSFAKARSIKPDYWPAYSHWAEFLKRSGRRDDALSVVKTGLQQAPTAKTLHELYRALGGKPGDIPQPIAPPIPPTQNADGIAGSRPAAEETNGND